MKETKDILKETKDILFDDLLKKIPNKYILTIMAGKRARDILGAEQGMLENPSKDTVVKRVLNEILSGQIIVENEA